jgi:hypothetical protein
LTIAQRERKTIGLAIQISPELTVRAIAKRGEGATNNVQQTTNNKERATDNKQLA